MVEGISWPWIFWLNVPIALVLIALTCARIDESHGPRSALDVPGLTLVTGASLAVVWALVRGNDAGNAAAFFWSAALLGTLFFIAQFLQTALGYGPLAAGLRLMPWGVVVFVVPLFATRLMARFGDRPIVAGGLVLQAAGTAWIALIAEPELHYWQMVAPLVVAGAGFAVAIPSIQRAVMNSVTPESIGRAAGTLSTMRQLGSVFGVAIAAAVFAGSGSYDSAAAFNDGFVAAIAACPGLSLLGAFAGLAADGA